jgi:putative endonuclease
VLGQKLHKPGILPGFFHFWGTGMWYVYICDKKGLLYTGITTDLAHRMNQHKATLLYSEEFDDKQTAARRERQIKGWTRQKKLTLIDRKR